MTELANVVNGSTRAQQYVEEKKSIRNIKTDEIKHSASFNARAGIINDCPIHAANRAQLLPELERKGITLNAQDQLLYMPGFTPPELKTADCWLVRHGETPGNALGMRQGACDGPANQLNKNGKSQASKLRHNHKPCDVLLCSPLGRTQHTALPIVLGELDKGNRVKITMDPVAQEKGYFNHIAHELSNQPDIGFDEDSGSFYRLDKSTDALGEVEVAIDFRYREMSFGAKENESVHGVDSFDPSHAMEYDQNAVFKHEEPFREDYFVMDADGTPERYDDGKPKIAKREIPAESFGEMVLRAFDNTDHINENYANKRVGIVGHGIITRGMLVTRQSDLIKVDPNDQHLMIDGAQATKVPNAKMIELQPQALVENVKKSLDALSNALSNQSSRIWG